MKTARALAITVVTFYLVNSLMPAKIASGVTMGNWTMADFGPGKGPSWFLGGFNTRDYEARIGLNDLTPAPNGEALFLVEGANTNVDMIIDGALGITATLTLGYAGDWMMYNEGPGKSSAPWFDYFKNEDYDARISLWTTPGRAPTKKSLLDIGGTETDVDLILDGRLGLINSLVVGGEGKTLFADVSTGRVGIGTTSPSKELTVRGNIVLQSKTNGATILELGEGMDYAEGFDVSEKDEVGPGTVLVIDENNTGKLMKSAAAYDTKVAGIVAGAKNLGSGVRLGTGQFDQNVALAGRVYCNVDATETAVRAGDLLTTSATPGYAMKVSDHVRAQGAVLGKAMESLEQGKKGQILVLVTLQ